MSNKIEYFTEADSIVGTSFKNVLLAPYGKVSTSYSDVDVTDQVEFRGLPTFDKLDVQDGISGRKYWIKDETRKPEDQLNCCIWNQLSGSDQFLICYLLHDSHTMSHNLYTLISTYYEDNMHSGNFDSTQAWKLTSSFFFNY